MNVAIIGGGAAGFFAALSCREAHPDANITIYEKSGKLLSKVKVSGGGRCNVTHACFRISELVKFYPRGSKQLKKAFGQFDTNNTVQWFEGRGVKLKSEPDNRMFPVTDNSQTVIDCLMREAKRADVHITMHCPVIGIAKEASGFLLKTKEATFEVDKVIVTTGGSPKQEGFDWLRELGHVIEPPVPSLFTFNMPNEPIKKLMGLSVPYVAVRVQGTRLNAEGPLLITHWGMSGPAILKLSAFGARVLHELNYEFNVQVSWVGVLSEREVQEQLEQLTAFHTKKKVLNLNTFGLPSRLWGFLIQKIDLREDITWGELGKKGQNRMVNILTNDIYKVQGKTTFKEEFVTCGGVGLQDVDFNTMQSRKVEGLYFAGEVLDIDGVTGGFNFQAAWTTGFIAGKLLE
ncbi:hypothetical protein C900_04127 [Fulvivirga imtechensis AK7]|uniref:NAD(FAD)-utilizing dehydrogenase n=1 Tax=Fulvivirga imtechensis AK7 TaxID=1237149 RepID=L8JWY5_9BACT|nr:NAD(P)/FAD-dependent oxidoreductase [Fulvivirga imtechensis]ELR73275.1 hypothetical protein C900_04127 [Fulvivirga imtechensis AK7]